jgi:predicted lipoprotein with Yx(FWY)xxD motif
VSITVHTHSAASARRLLGIGVISVAAVTVAACGASSSGSSGAASGASSAASSSSPSSAGSASSGGSTNAGAAAAAATVSAKSVSGLGTVLVNQKGQTLYMLTSEKGDKIACMASSGCLHAWPEVDLPSGTKAPTAGSGVKASLLGTVKGATGQTEVTYNGWPLYTFIGDTSAGSAKGQGLTNFGGTWYVLNTAGNPVTAKATSAGSSSPASSSTSSGGSGSGGYGY